MTTKYTLDKSFGPVGTVTGSLLFVAGLIISYGSWFGVVPVLLGAFVGFSSTSSIIDHDKGRIKFSNNLFGIIHTGKWITVVKAMNLGIKETSLTWSAYSRGDRPLDITKKDYRVVLYDPDNKEIMEIKKNNSSDSAKADLEILSCQLGLGIL
jgi:hypothetical protein